MTEDSILAQSWHTLFQGHPALMTGTYKRKKGQHSLSNSGEFWKAFWLQSSLWVNTGVSWDYPATQHLPLLLLNLSSSSVLLQFHFLFEYWSWEHSLMNSLFIKLCLKVYFLELGRIILNSGIFFRSTGDCLANPLGYSHSTLENNSLNLCCPKECSRMMKICKISAICLWLLSIWM